jgi:MinD-like ATPase involved in chromosome partitioning or flagellar assembly
MLVSLVAAKGAPGVTTATLALAAAAAGRGPALMVEADPCGGVLECWCGPLGEPGLLAIADKLRPSSDADLLWDHAVRLGVGVPALVGPTTAAPMSVALTAVGPSLGSALAGLDATVFVDAGRWIGHAGAAALLATSSRVVVVCRPLLDSIEHARGLIAALAEITTSPSVLVVGGSKPYGPADIEAALRSPVVGVLPWDTRGLNAMLESNRRRTWASSPLARAATEAVENLVDVPAVEHDRV